ncbi:MAG: cyclic nucleotide-binding domain-containing protein [Gammaproteobacteria bacterium]|nr:MAG: cyclic nucleotide-binding domain-containing protein [Gammaproteobacteria bacterium]
MPDKESPALSSTFHTMSQAPDKLGKYFIVGEIGRGSMGTVYAANDPFTDRKVAIKVAHQHFINRAEDGERFKKMFFNEAHAASVLNHPNILRLYDADVDREICYLVMELVEGARTLEKFCKGDALLPLRDVVSIVYTAAKALDYAHRQGVIHRDIKPSNILYTRDNQIKISDFSIAMVNRQDAKTTQFDGFIGSPLYMSPEQINEWEITSASDLFSLGVVMYELLTGYNPFKADTLYGIAQKITNTEPPSLNELRQDLPAGLTYTMKRLLKKKPDKRYRYGLDLAADLALIFEDLDKVESQDALQEKFGILKNVGFLKGFTDTEIWELVRASIWQKYPSGTTIIAEGEIDDAFYILLSGVVSITKKGRHIGNLQDGDCFGEMGYLNQTKRTATVVSKTDVSLIKVNAATLDRAEESTQLRFLKAFVNTVISRLDQTTSSLSQLKQI